MVAGLGSRRWTVAAAGLVFACAAAFPLFASELFSSAPPSGVHSAVIANLERYLAEVEAKDGSTDRFSAGVPLLAQLDSGSTVPPASGDCPPGGTTDGGTLLGADCATPPASGDLLAPSGDDLLAPSSDNLLAPAGDDLLAPAGDDLLVPAAGDDLLAPAESPDELLTGEGQLPGADDLLSVGGQGAGESQEGALKEEQVARTSADEEHEKLFLESKYPSANTCATCHPRHYEQWSVSQHAYAQLSPVFNAMAATINLKTSNTNGDFCVRCHTPIGMNIKEPVYMSNLDRTPASREGITCVACHRVSHDYGKISGRFALEEGNLFSPVYGPTGNAELKRVLSLPEEYRVSTSPDDPGRGIHTDVVPFFAITEPGFCGTCHDVTLLNGFRLEEAFAEFKAMPAAKNSVSCQDCHMGKEQGVASGYDFGPAAIVGEVPTRDRKLTNHFFGGPDYSIVHPGIFPHNVEAAKFKTLAEWLQFDYRAGWGTDAFEDTAPKDFPFPEAWKSIDDRYDAQEILKVQFERLEKARVLREEVLRNGYKLSDIQVLRSDGNGLQFSLDVSNGTDGHGVPTGFDAERLVFLQVTVTDSRGNVVYVSGDRDPNGDVRDQHSLYVHNGELPLDADLFSLQSKFVVRLMRGGEREQVLAVNTSGDVLPFVRPEAFATSIYGRPQGARKHKQNIEPGGSRTALYNVPASVLRRGERYSITAELVAQMVPVNLIAAIQEAGFDYNMSPAQIAREVVRGSSVLWTREAVVELR